MISNMKCEYCGNEIDDNSKFCRYCGKEQAPIKLCIKCGKELGLEDKWCRYCGTEQSKSDVAESFDTPNIGRLSDDENQVINDAIKGVDKRKNLFGKKSLIAIDITFIIVAIGLVGGVVLRNQSDSIEEICDSTEVAESIVDESLTPEDEARHFAEEFIKMVVDANNNCFCYSTNDEYYDRYKQSQTQNEKNILSYCSNGFKSLWAREMKLCKASYNDDLVDEDLLEMCGPGYALGEGDIHNLNDYVLHQGDDDVHPWDEMCKITDYSIQGIGMLDGNKRAKCNIGLEKHSCYGDDVNPMHYYVSQIELIKEDGKWVVDDINGFRATESSIKRAEDYHYSHGGKQL